MWRYHGGIICGYIVDRRRARGGSSGCGDWREKRRGGPRGLLTRYRCPPSSLPRPPTTPDPTVLIVLPSILLIRTLQRGIDHPPPSVLDPPYPPPRATISPGPRAPARFHPIQRFYTLSHRFIEEIRASSTGPASGRGGPSRPPGTRPALGLVRGGATRSPPFREKCLVSVRGLLSPGLPPPPPAEAAGGRG